MSVTQHCIETATCVPIRWPIGSQPWIRSGNAGIWQSQDPYAECTVVGHGNGSTVSRGALTVPDRAPLPRGNQAASAPGQSLNIRVYIERRSPLLNGH